MDARKYSTVIDAERELYGMSDPQIEAWWYEITKHTTCGVWINASHSGKKFIRMTARKRYADYTLGTALQSFLVRKTRQIEVLEKQLQEAKLYKTMADRIVSLQSFAQTRSDIQPA